MERCAQGVDFKKGEVELPKSAVFSRAKRPGRKLYGGEVELFKSAVFVEENRKQVCQNGRIYF